MSYPSRLMIMLITVLMTASLCATEPTWQNTSLQDWLKQHPPSGWHEFFNEPAVKQEIQSITQALQQKVKQGDQISPAIENTFKALAMVPLDQVKVVILGQDPAPTPGLATGLSFSIRPDIPTTEVPSVRRVLYQAGNEGICVDVNQGDLTHWARQGVLLLNSALTITCPAHEHHCQIGSDLPLWHRWTQLLLSHISEQHQGVVFILWGSKAKAYQKYICRSRNTILVGGHPSPEADGDKFFCRPYFTCANQWLRRMKRQPIDWSLASSCTEQQNCVWSKSRTPDCLKPCAAMHCSEITLTS